MSKRLTPEELAELAKKKYAQNVKKAIDTWVEATTSDDAIIAYKRGIKRFLGKEPAEDIVNAWKNGVKTKGRDAYADFAEIADKKAEKWYKNYRKKMLGIAEEETTE